MTNEPTVLGGLKLSWAIKHLLTPENRNRISKVPVVSTKILKGQFGLPEGGHILQSYTGFRWLVPADEPLPRIWTWDEVAALFLQVYHGTPDASEPGNIKNEP